MANPKPKTRGTVTNIATRSAAAPLRADAAPETGADTTPGTATLTTVVSGTITIGTTDIPISTPIPPKTAGVFEFDYKATDMAAATKISVTEFVVWAAAQIDPSITKASLPTSLQDLSVAVAKLSFSTKGNLNIKVEVGKDQTPWNPTWQPIPGLDTFKISHVSLEVTRTVPAS